MAAHRGSGSLVKLLLSCRAQVDRQTARGHTALHYAAYGGHVSVLLELMKGKAELGRCVCGKQGVNAFFMAVVQDSSGS